MPANCNLAETHQNYCVTGQKGTISTGIKYQNTEIYNLEEFIFEPSALHSYEYA